MYEKKEEEANLTNILVSGFNDDYHHFTHAHIINVQAILVELKKKISTWSLAVW